MIGDPHNMLTRILSTIVIILAVTSRIGAKAINQTVDDSKILKNEEYIRASDGNLYPVVPMQWNGPLYHGGPEVVVNGTIEEAIAQLQNYPNFNEEAFFGNNVTHDFNDTEFYKETTSLTRRAKHLIFQCVRTDPRNGARRQPAYLAAQILLRLGDRYCSASGGRCARVSCQQNAGIYLCSFVSEGIRKKCSEIGVMARKLIEVFDQDARGERRPGPDDEPWCWNTSEKPDWYTGWVYWSETGHKSDVWVKASQCL